MANTTDTTPPATDATQPVTADQPDPKTLAVGAADMATPAVQPTELSSGMQVITTPQGKASVDVNAPDFVAANFDAAAQASPTSLPEFDGTGKRIIGTKGLRGSPVNNKGSFVVMQSMVTTAKGSYVSGQFIAPTDLTDDERDLLLESGALAKQ